MDALLTPQLCTLRLTAGACTTGEGWAGWIALTWHCSVSSALTLTHCLVFFTIIPGVPTVCPLNWKWLFASWKSFLFSCSPPPRVFKFFYFSFGHGLESSPQMHCSVCVGVSPERMLCNSNSCMKRQTSNRKKNWWIVASGLATWLQISLLTWLMLFSRMHVEVNLLDSVK